MTLIHVLDSTPANDASLRIAPVGWHIRKSEMRAYLDAIVANIQRDGLKADAVLLEGKVVDCIAGYAQAHAVDLLVLCSHGHGTCQELPLGGTAQGLLLRCIPHKLIVHVGAGRPVETSTAARRYQRILLPLDGSWRAECALPLAHALAERMGAMVTYAHAVRKPEMARRIPLTGEETDLEDQIVRRNHADVKQYFQQLSGRVVLSTSAEIVSGINVGLALQTLAERLQTDLVVLTAHGFSGEIQQPYGSVAGFFATNSVAPVLIVQDRMHDQPDPAPAPVIYTRQQETPQYV